MNANPNDPRSRITSRQFRDGSLLLIDQGGSVSQMIPELAPRLREAEGMALRLLAENPGKEISIPVDMRGIVPAEIGCAVAVFQCGQDDPTERGWKWFIAIGGGEAGRVIDEVWRSFRQLPSGSAASLRHLSI